MNNELWTQIRDFLSAKGDMGQFLAYYDPGNEMVFLFDCGLRSLVVDNTQRGGVNVKVYAGQVRELRTTDFVTSIESFQRVFNNARQYLL